MFLIAGIIGLPLLYSYAWPGLWVYGQTSYDIYRVNRFTGTKEWPTDQGWKSDSQLVEKRRWAEHERVQKREAKLREDALAGKIEFATLQENRLDVKYQGRGVEIYLDREGDDTKRYAEFLRSSGIHVNG